MATGTIRAVASSASTLRDIPFSIATTAWTLNGNYYTATFSSAYVTASSKDFVTYDASLRENATSDINMEKTAGGGSVIFSTRTLPVGTITGTLFSVANQDGKTTMVVEDTVLPIVNGGTGANDVAGARQNLGIYVANNITTTEEGFILDARQGKAINDILLNTPLIVSNSNGTGYKFNNGLLICEKSVSKSVSCTSAWGSMYESTSSIEFGSWPVAFSNYPTVIANTVRSSGELACAVEMVRDYSTTSAGNALVYRPTSASGTARVHIVGIGLWKAI